MRVSIKYSIYKRDCYCSPMAKTQSKADKAITTKVVGGIGNQLFCYFAGYYLAKKLGYGLKIDVSDIRNKRSVHDVSIEALELPGIFFETPSSPVVLLLGRIHNKLTRALPIFRISKTSFTSNEIGFDPLLDKMSSPASIQGYFQSYKYFTSFSEDVNVIKLKNPSSWYLQMEKNVANKEFTSLHVRRGDYRNHSETFGLLSVNYYVEAIRSLSQQGELHKLYIFSDDIHAAREMLNFIVPAESVWIDPPAESNPVESLMLMSLASSNIIANSTYSWWGATLNIRKSAVIAPSKWFRSMKDPAFLYPPEWKLIESKWED
jgi:hypothetical protein